MKTYVLKAPEIKRSWYLIDAAGKPLGRVAAKAAHVLMGKNKASYTKHLDNGDFVVIINAEKIILTGRKSKTKVYHHYSGFVGGLRDTPFLEMIAKKPFFPIEQAVKGMLPKNHLARVMAKKLHLFEGPEHTFKNVELKPLEI
jgi:large subunit ribosomal protein L13